MVLFGSTYIIHREDNVGYYDDSGNYVEGERVSFSITADCQSLTAKELESLNIGRDNLGKIKVFSDEELIVAIPGTDGTNLRNGDRIIFNNDYYELIQRQKFGNLIPHYEYIGELRTNDDEWNI